MNLQTREDLFNYFDALQKKHANEGNSQKQNTSRNIPKKTNVAPKTSRPKKRVLFLETMPKKDSSQYSSGYDPEKVRAERAKRGQEKKCSGAGSSKAITPPKERERYSPAKVRDLREKRKKAKATDSTPSVTKKLFSVQKSVFSSNPAKRSSSYNPAKAKEAREQRNGERGKGLINDFEKYMIK